MNKFPLITLLLAPAFLLGAEGVDRQPAKIEIVYKEAALGDMQESIRLQKASRRRLGWIFCCPCMCAGTAIYAAHEHFARSDAAKETSKPERAPELGK